MTGDEERASDPSPVRKRHWIAIGGGAIVLPVSAALLALAMFPWGSLRMTVERRLSDDLGRPVSIARITRLDRFSLHPVLEIQNLRVPQAQWAGKGMLVEIERARLRFAVLPLLLGRFEPEALAVTQGKMVFVRDAQGRKSWDRDEEKTRNGKAGRPHLQDLSIENLSVIYRDAKQDRSMSLTVRANAREGLVMQGTGAIHGNAVTLFAKGGRIIGADPGEPWPFEARIEGKAVGMTMKGQMDGPLDIGHLTASATAHGDDLALVDAIIEAGLPGTQAVKLSAEVRRDSPDWKVSHLTGMIGHSDIAGDATIVKRDGRTRIEGAARAHRFDFRDLSSDQGIRKAAAKRARFGDRVIPDTAIDLTTVDKTDGKLSLHVDELLWPGSSPFRSLAANLTLEKSMLRLEPLTLGLTRGRLTGDIVIDQRNGGPKMMLDLAVRDARLLDFFPEAMIDGSLHGRIRLTGAGKSIRLAMGRSTGTVALVAEQGVIPARTASLLGQDIGRGLTTDKDEKAVLRCMITRLDVTDGTARPNPIIIDTSRAFTRATGSIDLKNEGLALMLSGKPKKSSILRLSGSVPIGGTIKAPEIRVPKDSKSTKGVLKMLGRAIAGKQDDIAQDADCKSLSAQALR
jgi:AsmA family protein